MRFEASNWNKLFVWLTHLLFLVLFIGLPISKALASISIAGLLITSIVLIKWKDDLTIQKSAWVRFSPWLLLFVLIGSFFLSSDWSRAWKVLYKQNTLLILPLAFWVHRKLLRDHLTFYIKAFVVAVAFCSGLTTFFFLLPTSATSVIVSNVSLLQDYVIHEKENAFGAYSPFIDRLHFSYLLGTALLLQLYLLFKNSGNHIWKIALLLLNFACLLLLGGRGAQLGFLGSAAIWITFLYWRYAYTSIKKYIGTLGAVGFLFAGIVISTVFLPYLLYQKVPAVQARYNQLQWEIGTYQDNTFTNYPYEHFTSLRRLMSWKYNLEIIKDKPILGSGIGDYQADLQARYDRDALKIPVHSHHQFLYYWAATGIVGFLIFVSIFCAFLYVAFKKQSWLGKALLFSFWVFYLIVFMFDSPLIYQTGGLAFWVFFLALIEREA